MSGVIKLTDGTVIKGTDLDSVVALDSNKEEVEEYWDNEVVFYYRFYYCDGRVRDITSNKIDPSSEEDLLDAIDTM
ncbi:hypothetical protein H6G06_14375 [Anabaena sphaerica FACHB-251]|uniref:Uncharacterized protein n=1 Tax=Anabaena sphaerica FACHB-251 TaxID=2692883 RepID=A0A926WIC7_9NOST|nr:hypothetical protein [Anabaena sphaerica]MBD2294632.1 hypothetical protein [Anabaena sphaerica FACHB-251]